MTRSRLTSTLVNRFAGGSLPSISVAAQESVAIVVERIEAVGAAVPLRPEMRPSRFVVEIGETIVPVVVFTVLR